MIVIKGLIKTRWKTKWLVTNNDEEKALYRIHPDHASKVKDGEIRTGMLFWYDYKNKKEHWYQSPFPPNSDCKIVIEIKGYSDIFIPDL